MRNFSLTILDRASWRTRLARVDRLERGQALLRVSIVGLIYLIYLYGTVWRPGPDGPHETEFIAVGAGFVLLSFGILLRIIWRGGSSNIRRVLGMVADNAATTYCLIRIDEGGAFVLFVYLFVAFGNGLRFGAKSLRISQVMALVGFSLVWWLSPFWSQHFTICFGFMVALLVLPYYVAHLSQVITVAKKRADEANQAKGRFLANMSHEMRTPLNGVIAMADVLRETTLSDAQRRLSRR